MIFFCRKTSTADGRTRWSVCVPTLMGFTTIAWFYSEDLADNFIRHLESNEEDRRLASLDAWREFQFRLDFIWSEKLQQDRGLLENHWQDIQKVLEAYNRRIHELLRDTASYHSEAFTAIWNESFQELGAIPGLEKLAHYTPFQFTVNSFVYDIKHSSNTRVVNLLVYRFRACSPIALSSLALHADIIFLHNAFTSDSR